MIGIKKWIANPTKKSDIPCIYLFNWLGITPTINDYFFY